MHSSFSTWLGQRYPENTKSSRLSNVRKIEEYYGDLQAIFLKGTFQQDVISTLEYSLEDERNNRPNPSKLRFKGNIRNNLNMYKNAAWLYHSFLQEIDIGGARAIIDVSEGSVKSVEVVDEIVRQKLSLERDMQVALRQNIESLDPNLKIIDNGAEKSVDSGFIDIVCEDIDTIVVIELKAGKADSRAIGQILGYMGDLQEEEKKPVRGILVAHEFDQRVKSASRVVPSLTLKKYAIEFQFVEEK